MLWELLEPLLDGPQVVLSSASISVVVIGDLVDRKTNSRWAFQEEHVRIVVPREWIFGWGESICTLIQYVRTMLLQESWIIC